MSPGQHWHTSPRIKQGRGRDSIFFKLQESVITAAARVTGSAASLNITSNQNFIHTRREIQAINWNRFEKEMSSRGRMNEHRTREHLTNGMVQSSDLCMCRPSKQNQIISSEITAFILHKQEYYSLSNMYAAGIVTLVYTTWWITGENWVLMWLKLNFLQIPCWRSRHASCGSARRRVFITRIQRTIFTHVCHHVPNFVIVSTHICSVIIVNNLTTHCLFSQLSCIQSTMILNVH